MEFPALQIIEPQAAHTCTVILLHGRASDGPEFAEELIESNTSTQKNLIAHFPDCRWVFPTSRQEWNATFQEDLTSWFNAYSLANPSEKQDLQIDGLRESTQYILDIIRREIDLLEGKSESLILGGISQGMATALWALLRSPSQVKGKKIGGFLGMCGWLPFANKIDELKSATDVVGGRELGLIIPRLLCDIIGYQDFDADTGEIDMMLSTPVLLLHGTDDIWVDVGLGREAHQALVSMGMDASLDEYSGAENEGHWIKEPEGFDAIARFLEAAFRKGGVS